MLQSIYKVLVRPRMTIWLNNKKLSSTRPLSKDGYTIVEAMIFLAVSAALLASAMLLLNGQQRRTEFSARVREFDAKLQSIISNVASGYYNNTGMTSCTVSGGTITVTTTSGSVGSNSDCTFIGQYLSLPASSDKFIITSYAGLRRVGTPPKEVQNLTEANPTPIASTAETYKLLGGTTASMKIVGGSAIDVLAVVTTFSQYSGNDLASGSSRVEVHAKNTTLNTDVVNPPAGVQICLTDGSQVGVIVLNSGSTKVSIGSSCP